MKHLKPLILSGKISTYGQLFEYVSAGEVAKAMGCSVDHVNYLKLYPMKARLIDIANLT